MTDECNPFDETITPYEVYRGEAVSIEQMCAALPKLFDLLDLTEINVRPFPKFSAKNELGADIIIVTHKELDQFFTFDLSKLLTNKYKEFLQ